MSLLHKVCSPLRSNGVFSACLKIDKSASRPLVIAYGDCTIHSWAGQVNPLIFRFKLPNVCYAELFCLPHRCSCAAGAQMNADSYKSILYLIAGGESWLAPYKHLPVPWPLEARKREFAINAERTDVDVSLPSHVSTELIMKPCWHSRLKGKVWILLKAASLLHLNFAMQVKGF